jgi:hypothetical protein
MDEPVLTYEIVMLYPGNFTLRVTVTEEQFTEAQSKYRQWESNSSAPCVVYDAAHADILTAYRLDLAVKVEFHIVRVGHTLS